MVQGILILVFMLFIMGLMVTRKMPTVIALFVLTVGICLIGGVPAVGVDADGNAIGFLQGVIQAGSLKLGDAIMVSIFAGWLGMVMEKTRISETMIKKGAELGGDKTLIVTLLLFIVSALLFTTVNGLGTVIMIGTIVIPILVSVGADKFTATAVMLFAYCVGNNVNLSNVNAMSAVMGGGFDDAYRIQIVGAVAAFISGMIFFIGRYRKTGRKSNGELYQAVGECPEMAKILRCGSRVAILFKNVGDGLIMGGQKPKALEIRQDGKTIPILAVSLQRNGLILECGGFTDSEVLVEYVWGGYCEVNLHNSVGLPVKPFRGAAVEGEAEELCC